MKKKTRIVVHNETWVEQRDESLSASPYASWQENQRQEPATANPDTLADITENKFWGTNVPPQLAELIIERFTDELGNFPILSKRENQIIRLYTLGISVNDISKELRLSKNSVKTYLRRISSKLKRLTKTLYLP